MTFWLIFGAFLVFGGIWFAAQQECTLCHGRGVDESGNMCLCRWKDEK